MLDAEPATIVVTWPQGSRSQQVAAFVRTAAEVAAKRRDVAEPAAKPRDVVGPVSSSG